MHEKTLAELSQALQSKALSSVELTQHYLKRIEQLDGNLNSYITVTAESALEQAAAADARGAPTPWGRPSWRPAGRPLWPLSAPDC